jgi:hypothetical protein
MIDKMLDFLDNFEDYFMKELELVANDNVRNVRISVAKVLKKHIEKKGKAKIQFPEYFSFTKASSPQMKDSLPSGRL